MDTKSSKIICLAIIAAVFGAMPATAQIDSGLSAGNVLARDGAFFGKIFIPENAAPEERLAAKFLAAQIKKITGASAEIENETAGCASSLRAGIYVGNTAQALARGIEAAESAGETWRWESRGGRALFIRGNSPLATRLAVADYARRELGISFLMPGEYGEEWSPRRTLRLPVPYSREPAYVWRSLYLSGKPEESEWALNNGLGELPGFSHNLYSIFNDKAFAEHPEFFPVVGGVLKKPSGRGGYEPQPNLAAPGAAIYAAERAAEFFDKNPHQSMFSLGVNDNMTWDESPASAALLGRDKFFRGKPDYSDYVFSFMNRVAEATEKNPAVPAEKLFSCIAYYHCENTPSFPVNPRVFPVLTADRSQWRDPAFKKNDQDLIRRWSRSGVKDFGLYDYYYGNDYLIPRAFLENEIESIRFGARHGAKLFFAEVAPNWGFDGPKTWLAARLLQAPEQPAALLLREYFNAAYGPAAGDMRKFFEIAEQCWNEQPGAARWIKFWCMENMGALISPERERQMRAVITAAENAFPEIRPLTRPEDDERYFRQKIRVRMTSQAFAVTERFLEWYRIREKLLQSSPATPEAVRETVVGLQAEQNARNEFSDTFLKWKNSPMNPGGVPAFDAFFSGDIDATVCARLLQICFEKMRADDAGGAWRGALQEVAAWATEAGYGALVEDVVSPEKSRVLVADDFERESFRAPRAGAWSDGRDITVLKAPWEVVLFENQFVRAGYSEKFSSSGTGCLWISGGEQTTFSRRAPIAGGDCVIAKMKIRGRVNPGTYAGIEMNFFDKNGQSLGGTRAIIHPMHSDAWAPAVALMHAPAGATSVQVSIRNMSQEADEALFFDDFEIAKIN